VSAAANGRRLTFFSIKLRLDEKLRQADRRICDAWPASRSAAGVLVGGDGLEPPTSCV
jgi:hypothetical protein